MPALERAIFLTPSRDINLSSLSKFWFSFVRLRGSSISPVLLMAAKQYAAVRVSCHAQRKPRTSQHPMSTPRLALPARWGAGGSVVPHIHLPSVAQVSYTAVLITEAPSTKHTIQRRVVLTSFMSLSAGQSALWALNWLVCCDQRAPEKAHASAVCVFFFFRLWHFFVRLGVCVYVNVHRAVAVGFGFFTHPRVCNNAWLACLRRVRVGGIRSSGRVFRGRDCIGI